MAFSKENPWRVQEIYSDLLDDKKPSPIKVKRNKENWFQKFVNLTKTKPKITTILDIVLFN